MNKDLRKEIAKIMESYTCDVVGDIASFFQKQNEELVEEIKGMQLNRKDMFYGKSEIEYGFETSYNKALNNVIKLLEQKV